jgi:inositol-phosphate transport system substrate-binding protein
MVATVNKGTMKACRGWEEIRMIHWKIGTAALLSAALVGGSAAFLAATPLFAQEAVKLELWSRQDPSGPLRAGNVVKAAERLNKELEA